MIILDYFRNSPLNEWGFSLVTLVLNFTFYKIYEMFTVEFIRIPTSFEFGLFLFLLVLFDLGLFYLNFLHYHNTSSEISQPDNSTSPIPLPTSSVLPIDYVELPTTGNQVVELPLYNIKDAPILIDNPPHVLITGATGTGKSNLTRHLIPRYNNSKFAVIDNGGLDFPTLTARTAIETAQVIDAAYFINRGRSLELEEIMQRQGRETMLTEVNNMPRIIVLWEEMEAGLANLKTLSKESYNRAINQLLNLTATARKTHVNLFGIVQKGDANTIPTNIRDNMHNLYLTTCGQNVSWGQFKIRYQLDNLPIGYVYNKAMDALVYAPLNESAPIMNVISMRDLQLLARGYVRTYELTYDQSEYDINYADERETT